MMSPKDEQQMRLTIAKNLNNFSSAYGFNDETIADFMNLKINDIVLFKKAMRTPNLLQLIKFSELFTVPIDYIVKSENRPGVIMSNLTGLSLENRGKVFRLIDSLKKEQELCTEQERGI